jgi:phospholipid/cholesterol/gamma-HCH transport system substrate-binding protein
MTREFRLGVFILGTLLILAAGIFLIGDKRSLFSSTYLVKSDFQNAAGLEAGAEVRVGGIREGTVKYIQLPRRPDEKVTVVMNVEDSTRAVVKKDSTAAIKAEGLLGDKYVEISFGSPGGAPLKDGDTIGSEPLLDISDLIKKTDQILDTTKDSLQNVQATTSNLEAVSAKINQGKGTMGGLINDPTVYREASAGATAFAENMEALKHNFLLRGFFQKRGYEDSEELTKHAVAQLPSEPPTKEFTYSAKQFFDNPQATKLKHPKILNQVGAFLEQNEFGLVVVAARAGMTGDSEKDRSLTEAQSAVIRDYLVQNFKVDDARIKTIGLGKAKSEPDSEKIEIMVYRVGLNVPASRTAATARK